MSGHLDRTHTSRVTADQIDELGHMNVRYYVRNAAAGTDSMVAALGLPPSTALVDLYTRHHHEQMLGSELEVRSGLLAVGGRLGFYHELTNAADGDLGATFVHVLDHPALEAPTVDIPDHGRPRTLDLTADPIASAPTLSEVAELGLENRAVRLVDDEDTLGGDRVPPAAATGLIWGGLPPDGVERNWIQRRDDGVMMGWATMESRVTIASLPAKGTRIQSFGAVTAMERKTNRMIMWAYDIDTEDLLVVFEVVNLAFDIEARRSMLIPDDVREADGHRLHPEFLPR